MTTLTPRERSQLTSDAQDNISGLFDNFKTKVTAHIASLDGENKDIAQSHLERITSKDNITDAVLVSEASDPALREIDALFCDFQKEAIARIAVLPEKNAWFVQRHFTKIAQDGFQKEIFEQRLLVSARQMAPDLEFDRVVMETNSATFEPVMALYRRTERLGRLCKRYRYFDDPLRIETYYELDKEN